MANKCFSYVISWCLIFLFQLQQIQSAAGSINAAAGSNATSVEVIHLRVGVPKKDGFPEFVNVVWDANQKKYNVTGYCMDVFHAVVNLLPFNVSLIIEPYVNESRESAGTYDSLVQQVPTKYDAVVGDISIVANRSEFVDFTLPYVESGVRMLVKVEHGRHQSMWIFAKPFSWDLWLSIVIISMFIGFVILIMERNNAHTTLQQPANQEQEAGSLFRKQLSAINILWFPISQAVLPERQVVAKNCSRFVLMVWLLLAFVLMQSYTANLTTILTMDQMRPSFLSVNELRKGGHYIGFQANSFAYDLLVQQLKFNPSKLKAYGNVSGYYHALKSGDVSAIFDEGPYFKVFLKKYGSNYMMAGPTYPNDGFGFGFPLNSNLTAHFSRAILKVTENSNLMDEIEEKYLGKNKGEDQYSTQMSSSSSASPSFTAHSFAGLFLITVISTLLSVLVSQTVIWQRPISMAKEYMSQRYLSSSRTLPITETRVHPSQDHDSTHERLEVEVITDNNIPEHLVD